MRQVRNPRTGKDNYTFQSIAPAVLNVQLQQMRLKLGRFFSKNPPNLHSDKSVTIQ
jgi:hypothetical protein